MRIHGLPYILAIAGIIIIIPLAVWFATQFSNNTSLKTQTTNSKTTADISPSLAPVEFKNYRNEKYKISFTYPAYSYSTLPLAEKKGGKIVEIENTIVLNIHEINPYVCKEPCELYNSKESIKIGKHSITKYKGRILDDKSGKNTYTTFVIFNNPYYYEFARGLDFDQLPPEEKKRILDLITSVEFIK